MIPDDVEVIDVNKGALADVNPEAVNEALPLIVTVVSLGKPPEGNVKVSLAAVPPTVIVDRFCHPVPKVVPAAAVEPLPVMVMFKAEVSALVSFNVNAVTVPVVKFKVLPDAPDKLLVIFNVAVPELVTVKLDNAFVVMVEFTPFGSNDKPANETVEMVDAAVALLPFESVILTIPSKTPPVAAVMVGAVPVPVLIVGNVCAELTPATFCVRTSVLPDKEPKVHK
jgi:hypothetical protein